MSESVNRISNVIALRERNLQISEIAGRMECSERTVRRLLEQGARSEQRIVDFEKIWRKRDVPRIEDFVPSQGNPTRGEILEELVRVDMEYRWRHPELCSPAEPVTKLPVRPRIEDYVRRFPELSEQGELPASLITEEFRVRMKWGDKPDYSEYQDRFPSRKNSLSEQLDRVHDDLAREQSFDDDLPPEPASPPPPMPEPETESEPESVDQRFNPTLDIRPTPATTDTTTSSRSDKYTTRAEPKKGGMAIVWRAFDSRLNREVAFKELRPDRATDREFLSMFLHEAQVTGQLEHPNIVPVYELGGNTEDRPYYTMKYVRGGTLSDVIEEYHERRKAGQTDPRDLHRLLNILLHVCHAVRYAHSRGVLHRDLKPDNVMVGDYGEVLLVDWGLAKVLGVSDTDLPAVQLSRTDQLFTEVGARKGTPAYWAPEQAEGRADLIDARTDIYGLGGLLYQILTGQVPHPDVDDDAAQVSRKLEVADPHEIEPSAPPVLASICRKAMAPQRSERYSKADELISDIESWRVDEPVSSYRESLPEQVLRQVRRNWIASVITVVGLLTIGLVLGVLHVQRSYNREAIMAREINRLSEFAGSQEAKLMARVNVLRQDVGFLSTLEPVHKILENPGAATDQKEHLKRVFTRFLEQRPEYMQLRLLDKNGDELVRTQRNTPEGKVISIAEDSLQNKGSRDYFANAMRVKAGGWYLSGIELNQENNKKDKNLPVIRGAVPVYVEEERPSNKSVDGAADDAANEVETIQSLEGVVIINLHFRKLVSDLRDFEESSASGLVYLTDAEGQFLYHPQKDIAFAFERDLDYRLQQLYPPLNEAYRARSKQWFNLDAEPQVALFVKPDTDFIRDEPGMWNMLNDKMATALISIETEHSQVKSSRGNEGDAIIFGTDRLELDEIETKLKGMLPVKVDSQFIGGRLAGEQQALHYNRLSLEPGNEERALGLALIVPHEALEADSSVVQLVTRITMAILAIGIVVLVYFIARRAPHTPTKVATV